MPHFQNCAPYCPPPPAVPSPATPPPPSSSSLPPPPPPSPRSPGPPTGLQVLVVVDVVAGGLLHQLLQLPVRQVLHVVAQAAPLVLRQHGLLQAQVAPGDLGEGQRGKARPSGPKSCLVNPARAGAMLPCPSLPSPQEAARTGTRKPEDEDAVERGARADAPQPGSRPLRVRVDERGTYQPPHQPLAADGAAHVLHAARDVEDQLPQPLLAFQALAGDFAARAGKESPSPRTAPSDKPGGLRLRFPALSQRSHENS